MVRMLMLGGCAYEQDFAAASKICHEALQSLTELGLGFRCAADGERMFDPVEVVNFMKRAGLDGRHDFYERYVLTGRRLVSDLAGEWPGGRMVGEREFDLSFQRVFDLRGMNRGSRLRLRVPLPLQERYSENISVTHAIPREAKARIVDGRFEVHSVVADAEELAVELRIKFMARQPGSSGGTLGELDRALYLQPHEGWVRVTGRISDLAHVLAPVGTSAEAAARSIWQYLNREFLCGAIHYDQIDLAAPGDWVLDSGWFDCQLGAALFVSLCRARGVPARLTGGRVLYEKAPTTHYWAQAWLNGRGWVPFDFLSWDLSRGGRDEAWRDYFFEWADFRMTTECLPRQFTGAVGVPIPKIWTLLQEAEAGGLKTTLTDATGAPIYTDTVRVSG